ncbi:ZIP family metal transporter [Salinisphaera sp. Q1T1-3]|uniref:ZIP family metal transporter n=1 Tax=Salinisphaera sp. Q1T1-3 TaxID=2321229 RepID=UPI000E77277F|nr:ZIP family metal transporter [Salinisphaera sp. Q1T1-3]RJS93365.1 ZIP family metal transporter [Salinisphaera sp. Q1T1-3]
MRDRSFPHVDGAERATGLDALGGRLVGRRGLSVLIALWGLTLAAGLVGGRDKLVVIAIVAFAAMMAGWWLAGRIGSGVRVAAAADGLAGGAMLTSAALFLLPMAVGPDPVLGSAGVAAGLVIGIALDRLIGIEHGTVHMRDASVAAITLHALAAGVVMGLIYARMPALGLLLGTAIISHKLPAGYALARNRRYRGLSAAPILWPAAMVGLAAIPVALTITPGTPADNAGLFGIATGVFMHVGQDFSRQRIGAPETSTANRWFVMAMLAGGLAVVALRWLVQA